MDAYVNLATSTVATAPSPATSGTSLVVAAGTGTRYPAAPFDVTLYAPGTKPDPTNAEIARCTAVSTDTLTLARAQYGTTAQPVAVGWYVDNDVTANFIGEMVALIPSPATTVVGPDSFGASAVVGTGTTFARADHNHGLPAAPAVPVTSVFTRTGAITAAAGDYTVSEITGAAPLASPALTGTPTAPTATALTNDTQLSTTAYTDSAVGVETTRAEAAEALKIALSTVTTAGDLIVASGAGAVTRLGVGTASQVLLGGATPTWGATPASTDLFTYVANYGSNTVSVIRNSDSVVVAIILVGTNPLDIAVTPNGSYVYVANNGSNSVSVIATATNTVVATINVGTYPYGVAVTPNGSHVYVANNTSNSVSVIATATNTVTATVTVGTSPIGVVATPNGSYVYVANSGSSTVSVIATTTNTVIATITVGVGPYNVAITPNGSHVYVTNYDSNSVSVIATATNTVTATVTVGTSPYYIAVTPNGSYVYVVNNGSNSVSVIATATNTVTATVSVGTNPYGLAITPDGSYVYVANYSDNTVSVIATATNTVIATIIVGTSPYGVAVTTSPVPQPNEPSTLMNNSGTATYGATASAPTVTSGTAFTPNAYTNSIVYFQINAVAAGSYTLTMGPTTGAENTIASAAAVTIGNDVIVDVLVPVGWLVVLTLTTVTLGSTLVVSC